MPLTGEAQVYDDEDMNQSTRLVPAVLATAAATVGTASLWRWMTNWGATDEEAAATLPGDEIVGQPRYRTTHAVTIDAPVEQVWPWLVQIGQGRSGMYSYDWVENLLGLHMHSADRIVPELQTLSVGDVIRMVPEGTQPDLHFVVAQLDPPYVMVLGPDNSRADALASDLPYPCWTFHLRALPDSRTRLVVRFQSDFKPTPLGWLKNRYALEPVHFVMERKMMLEIKDRAERGASAAAEEPRAVSR
jgi:hypothetical protein